MGGIFGESGEHVRMLLFVISCLVGFVGLSLGYIYWKHDRRHTFSTVGVGLRLGLATKLVNVFGGMYLALFSKFWISVDPGLINKSYLQLETDLLVNQWPSGPKLNLQSDKFVNLLEHHAKTFYAYTDAKSHPLSPMGRILIQTSLKISMINRKKLAAYMKDHPKVLQSSAIDDDNRMMIISGMHRTGSTYLQTILALDPNARTTRTVEMTDTLPLAQKQEEIFDNERIRAFDKQAQLTEWICPGYLSTLNQYHSFGASLPEEDWMFVAPAIPSYYHLNFIFGHIDTIDLQRRIEFQQYVCRYFHMCMKVLNGSLPPKSHWVTKNPDHIQYFAAL